MTTPAVQHFNSIAHQYDAYKSPRNFYYRVLKQAIKEQILFSSPAILDIGCGTGNMLEFLQPKRGVGIDISSEMIKLAKNKYKNNRSLTFQIQNIETTSIKGTFDYILFNDVIEHLTRPERAIHNLSRSMKLDTTLILSMANPAWEPLLMLLEKLHLKMPEGPHFRISEIELFQILKKYKLRTISKQTYFPKVQNWGLIYVYAIKKLV